jgi:peptidoglycan lytic transglycosylase
VRSARTIAAACFLLAAASAGAGREPLRAASSLNGAVPPALSVLARRADHRRGWAPLARYAASVRSPESKGLAYFALGYREFQGGDYPPALENLGRAAATGFSLEDFGAYYRAEAADQADEPDVAVHALAGFRARFPRSTLLPDATRVLARSQIALGAFQQALDVLAASAEFKDQPWYLLLLGEAQQKSGNLVAAAGSFNELYYRFPLATDAGPAAKALGELQSTLGVNFPAASIKLREARAEAFKEGDHFRDALEIYEALLAGQPDSASAPEWRLTRDRSLYGLDSTSDALADLAGGTWPPGDVDARRELLIVRCDERLADAEGIEAALDRLQKLYPASPSYASALNSASYFFLARGDRGRADELSARLAAGFPDSDLGIKAAWQVAFSAFLAGNTSAGQKIADYVRVHPGGPRVAGALYWLGRLAEAAGAPAVARGFYETLRRRFANNYFSLRAEERLHSVSAAPSKSANADPPWHALQSEVKSAMNSSPPMRNTAQLCPGADPGPVERRALTLAALGLNELAERDLRTRIATAGDSSALANGLRLDFARLARDDEKFDQAAYYARRVVPNYADYEFSSLPEDFWGLLYPMAFWSLLRRYASLNHLDPYLVMAVVREESGFNPRATSGASAHGLMQLMTPTARELARERSRSRRRPRVNLDDPATNLRLGCRYLSEMVRQFDGNLEEALAAYNAGPIRVRQWLAIRSFPEPAAFVEAIPFAATQAYVEAVLRDATVYRQLMTAPVKFKVCGSARARTAARRSSVVRRKKADRRTRPK